MKKTNSFIVKTKGGESLLGLLVWAQDYPPNYNGPRRIGTITNPGLNMVHYPYSMCGETIVHEKTLDDEAFCKSESAPFTWRVPDCGIHGDFVELRGICVTEKGFGKFAVRIPTNGVAAFGSITDAKCAEQQPKACKSIYDSPAPIRPVYEPIKPVYEPIKPVYEAPGPLKPSTPAANPKTQAARVTLAVTPVFIPIAKQAAAVSLSTPMYVPPVKAAINATNIFQSGSAERVVYFSAGLSAFLLTIFAA
ncbi:hypothetical protein HDU81_010898 [Chytriomyces hyalinus]|nr:hypothetical protein HDU81_010898 [Chytriomyces hyalinus]